MTDEPASEKPKARKKPEKRRTFILKRIDDPEDNDLLLYEAVGHPQVHESSAAAMKWLRANAEKAELMGAEVEIASVGKTIRPKVETKTSVTL